MQLINIEKGFVGFFFFFSIVSFWLLDYNLGAAQGKPVSFKWDPQYSTLKAKRNTNEISNNLHPEPILVMSRTDR